MAHGQGIQIPAGSSQALAEALRGVEQHVDDLRRQPAFFPAYNKADMPDPAEWLDHGIIVRDETGGRTIATSDGANWKRCKDGATVS